VHFSKIKTALAVIGFCTVLYLFGSWAIEIIDQIKVWLEGTGVTQ
jgi:hypothetical protein